MTDNRFAEYLPGIRRRWLQEQRGWEERRTLAWTRARAAAQVLRQHGAAQVLAFGSLVRTGPYDARSDIDLAEQGIPDDRFWRAGAEAAAAAGEFELDVVDLADCPTTLRDAIRREGVPL